MSFAFYLTAKLLNGGSKGFSRPVISVAIASVAVGLAVMILSVAIVTGFQQQIWDKVIGFGSHIRVTAYDNNDSYELSPIDAGPELDNKLTAIPGVSRVSSFITKAGIVQSKEDFEGVVFKGVNEAYDWSFFQGKIIEGQSLNFSDSNALSSVLVSRSLARKLQLKPGDPLRIYFIVEGEPQPRGRKFLIKGVYETGLGEMDDLFVLGHISHLRKINDWTEFQAGGIEIMIDDFRNIEAINKRVYQVIGYDLDSKTISEIYPQIFDWLKLQDMNVLVILILMIIVSAMAMISILLILILERAVMIGVLKSLGAGNSSIRRIFLMHGAYILAKGLFWGNVLGIGLCLIQQHTGIFTLPQESYFVSQVPINLEFTSILLLNAGTVLLCMVILLLPSFIISRISPVKTLRYN